ncbi:MAG: GTP cyclohydrolase II, partial [Alphaproteobacteria bacterium]|nr:GTP cyclohydrolase II [Alphaproteobacteria bacterium]
ALGFETDHRYYLPAAAMLRHLGHEQIRLLTNNPDKIAQIESCGITVKERIALTPDSNPYNSDYLNTKKTRTGHLLD